MLQYIKIAMGIYNTAVFTLIIKSWPPIFNHLLGHVNASVMKMTSLLIKQRGFVI